MNHKYLPSEVEGAAEGIRVKAPADQVAGAEEEVDRSAVGLVDRNVVVAEGDQSVVVAEDSVEVSREVLMNPRAGADPAWAWKPVPENDREWELLEQHDLDQATSRDPVQDLKAQDDRESEPVASADRKAASECGRALELVDPESVPEVSVGRIAASEFVPELAPGEWVWVREELEGPQVVQAFCQGRGSVLRGIPLPTRRRGPTGLTMPVTLHSRHNETPLSPALMRILHIMQLRLQRIPAPGSRRT